MALITVEDNGHVTMTELSEAMRRQVRQTDGMTTTTHGNGLTDEAGRPLHSA